MKIGFLSRLVFYGFIATVVGFVMFNWVLPSVEQDAEPLDPTATTHRYFRILPRDTLEYALPPHADQLRVITAMEFEPEGFLEVPTQLVYIVTCDWYDDDGALVRSDRHTEWTRLYFSGQRVSTGYGADIERRADEASDTRSVPGTNRGEAGSAESSERQLRTRWHVLHDSGWITGPRATTLTLPIGSERPIRRAVIRVLPAVRDKTGANAVRARELDDAPSAAAGNATDGTEAGESPAVGSTRVDTTPLPRAFLVRSYLRTSRSQEDAEVELQSMHPRARRRLVRFDPLPAAFIDDADLVRQLERDQEKWTPLDRPGRTYDVPEVIADDEDTLGDFARSFSVWEALHENAVIVLNLAEGDRIRIAPGTSEQAVRITYTGMDGDILTETRWLIPGLPRYLIPPTGTLTVTLEGLVGPTPEPVLIEHQEVANSQLWFPASPDRYGLRAVRCDGSRGDDPLVLRFPYPQPEGEMFRLGVSTPDLDQRTIEADFLDAEGNVLTQGTLAMPATEGKLKAYTSISKTRVTAPAYWYAWVPPNVAAIRFASEEPVYLGFSRRLADPAYAVELPRPDLPVIVRELDRTGGAFNPWQPVLPDDRAELEQDHRIELVLTQIPHVEQRAEPAPVDDSLPFALFAPRESLPRVRFLEPSVLDDDPGELPGADRTGDHGDTGTDSGAATGVYHPYPGLFEEEGCVVNTQGSRLRGLIIVKPRDEAPGDGDGDELSQTLWLSLYVDADPTAAAPRWRNPVFRGSATTLEFNIANVSPVPHRLRATLETNVGELLDLDALELAPLVTFFGESPVADDTHDDDDADGDENDTDDSETDANARAADTLYKVRTLWCVLPGQTAHWPMPLTPDTRVHIVVAPEITADEEARLRAFDPDAPGAELPVDDLALWTVELEPAADPALLPGDPNFGVVPDPRAWFAFARRDSDPKLHFSTFPQLTSGLIYLYGGEHGRGGVDRRLGRPVRGSVLLADDMVEGTYELTLENQGFRALWVRIYRRLDAPVPERPGWWIDED